MGRSPTHKLRRRPGWFRLVPLRARRDGWDEARQCAFLVHLYLTGSASAAARGVGMSRASAYRLRARAGAASFAAAWDRVLTPPGTGRVAAAREDFRKVTDAALFARLEMPLVQPVVFRGRMVGIRRKGDNSALLRLVRRMARESSGSQSCEREPGGTAFANTPGLCVTAPASTNTSPQA